MKQHITITFEDKKIIAVKHVLDTGVELKPENPLDLEKSLPSKNLICTLMTEDGSLSRVFIGIATPKDWWHESHDRFIPLQSEVS